MPTIDETVIREVMEGGNGAFVVTPASGGGFVRVSYLWGKLRVDRCDKEGKIASPERRGGGGDLPPPPVL